MAIEAVDDVMRRDRKGARDSEERNWDWDWKKRQRADASGLGMGTDFVRAAALLCCDPSIISHPRPLGLGTRGLYGTYGAARTPPMPYYPLFHASLVH